MLVYQRVFLNFCCWFLIYSPQFGNQTITSGDGNSVKPSFFCYQRAPAPAIPKIFRWKTHDVQRCSDVRPKKKREKLKATWWLIPPHPCLAASISSSSVNEELNIDSSWEPSRFEPNLFGYSLWHHSKMVCLGLSGWIFVFAIHTVCRSSVLSLQLIHPRHSLMSQPPQNLRATSQMTPFQGNGHGPCGGSHLLPPKIRENQGLLTVAFVDCINRKEKKP